MAFRFFLDITPKRTINKDLPPHYIRLLAYLAAGVILTASMLSGALDPKLWWTPLATVAYPLLSHLLTARARKQNPASVNSILILVDTVICGSAFIVLKFDPALCLFLFLIVSAGTVTIGGVFGWLISLCAMLLGAIGTMVAVGPPQLTFVPPNLPLLITGLASITVYVSVLGYFAFRQAAALIRIQNELGERQKESANLSRKLAKYLPPQVWGSIFSGQTDVKLQTQRKKLTVFFSDIKGFAEISEELQPEALTDLLNSYFTEMSRIALKYGGTIDKFVGDAILIFFGDPASRGQKQDAVACVSMALEMRKKMKLLRQQWRKEGISKPLQVRMGINSGYCTVGNFGAETRMDYTIIGREVNLASRLESVAQSGEILISEPTYNLVRDVIMCRDRGQINVKGFTKTVPIFEIVDHRKELGATQSFLEYELDGFSMYVDIDKIRNYDKDKIVESLEDAAKRIREKLIV